MRRWALNSGINKSFKGYVNSLLKYHLYTYRTDSEEILQYGWDTHNPFTDLLQSSATWAELVYTAKRLTYSGGSYTICVCICMEFVCTVSMHMCRILCLYLPLNLLLGFCGAGFRILYRSSLHHATQGLMYLSRLYSMTCIQAGQPLFYQSNNEKADASPV